MTDVWVLTSYDYSPEAVDGVFSSLEKAKRALDEAYPNLGDWHMHVTGQWTKGALNNPSHHLEGVRLDSLRWTRART